MLCPGCLMSSTSLSGSVVMRCRSWYGELFRIAWVIASLRACCFMVSILSPWRLRLRIMVVVCICVWVCIIH